MSHSANHLYEFGPFRLDPAERLLLRDGEPAPLPPKVFEILLLLVRNHGRLLKKEEMIAAIWPDAYVEEGNLTHYVSDLRKALGERRGEHSYIETVPRIGYRFVAEVREWRGEGDGPPEVEKESGAIQADTAVVEHKPASGRMASRLIITAGVILSTLAIVAWYAGRASRPQPVPAVKSIAVLPFKPLAVEGRDESFEMGMADSLIIRLSGIRELIVRPTSAVRKYTALDQDAVAAGRELRVEAVLDGSVQWSGERVRVSVRLLNVGDGATLWIYQGDEYCTDVFAAQDAISEKVASVLAPVLSNEEKRQLMRMYQEAIAEWRQAIAFDRSDRNLSRLGYAYAVAGQRIEARRVLQELEEQATRRHVSPVHIARLCAGLEDRERALDWLRKGYEERSDHMLNLGVDPAYDGLRADPRFVEMLRGIGLAP